MNTNNVNTKKELELVRLALARQTRELDRLEREREEVLYTITKADVDVCIDGVAKPTICEDRREVCYQAVRDLDSALIFDQIDALVELAMGE